MKQSSVTIQTITTLCIAILLIPMAGNAADSDSSMTQNQPQGTSTEDETYSNAADRLFVRGTFGLGVLGGQGLYSDGLASPVGHLGMSIGGDVALGVEITPRWDVFVGVGGAHAPRADIIGEIAEVNYYSSVDVMKAARLFVGPGVTFRSQESPLFFSAQLGAERRALIDKLPVGDTTFTDRDWGPAVECKGGFLLEMTDAVANGVSLSLSGMGSFDDEKAESAYSMLIAYMLQLG